MEPNFFFEDVDFLDTSQAFFGSDTAINGRKFLELEQIRIEFVVKATFEPTALSVQSCGVERKVLILSGIGVDVFKIGKPS
jgi:hypothetical protein